MLISKFIKLLGHYIRYPIDFLFLPLSILFGYFHGFIKLYAMLTLNVVSSIMSTVQQRGWAPQRTKRPGTDNMGQTTWGSREGADTADATRMIRVTPAERDDDPNNLNSLIDWYTK